MADIYNRISTSLNKLKSAMGWNQKEFADKWGVSTGALNYYLNATRLPDLELLINLCGISDFTKAGLEFGLDDLLDEEFDPESTIKFKRKNISLAQRIVFSR